MVLIKIKNKLYELIKVFSREIILVYNSNMAEDNGVKQIVTGDRVVGESNNTLPSLTAKERELKEAFFEMIDKKSKEAHKQGFSPNFHPAERWLLNYFTLLDDAYENEEISRTRLGRRIRQPLLLEEKNWFERQHKLAHFFLGPILKSLS